ncbi:hypothetical protein QQS21_011526 [Conoideocrella luteorostrata]|uniref:Uncharacterized protein n=1 Tax=Conoideocrella luteorostrata TaxID=1105319 RepID=A0AAJ0FT99_9HYPO|nr:hypothetical protein QQS21_011526 [Conoideocrella luteorostrata]
MRCHASSIAFDKAWCNDRGLPGRTSPEPGNPREPRDPAKYDVYQSLAVGLSANNSVAADSGSGADNCRSFEGKNEESNEKLMAVDSGTDPPGDSFWSIRTTTSTAQNLSVDGKFLRTLAASKFEIPWQTPPWLA